MYEFSKMEKGFFFVLYLFLENLLLKGFLNILSRSNLYFIYIRYVLRRTHWKQVHIVLSIIVFLGYYLTPSITIID
jgi:hypothetical protein